MISNDDTQLAGRRPISNTVNEPQIESESKGDDTWKKVGIGGVTGILVGAGAMFAGKAFAGNGDDSSTEQGLPKQANVTEGQSFSDAFNEARAQVGPGGVFSWHGRLYNTYTEEEWDAMSAEEKHQFAQAVAPQVNAHDAYAQTTSEDVHVASTHTHTHTTANVVDHHAGGGTATPASHTAHNDEPAPSSNDDDVHVVGVAQVNGHTAVALDLTDNGEADVAIIDINDNNKIDEADLVVDREGNVATMGSLAQSAGQDTDQSADDGMQATSNEDDTTATDPNIEASYSGDDVSSSVGGDDVSGGFDPSDDYSVAL